MTRQHWKDAGLYLLKGAFSYVHSLNDPMQFPKLPGKSYPKTLSQAPTEKLEGMCRTLFIASPLLREDSTITINNIRLGAYYRQQITNILDSTKSSYIRLRRKTDGPLQNLVEFGGLSLSLFVAPDVLWKPLPQKQKDQLATLMLSYGDGPTWDNNWKFFNIFILSFFKSQGYTVNDKLLLEYLNKATTHYRGDSWYQDGSAYDYYSMWAFQMYGPLWSHFYGQEHYPELAKKFMENSAAIPDNYPYLFSRDGKMIMWGRSMSYRMGAVIPLALTGLEKNNAQVNYGWMRRIASGTMLQFLQHPDMMKDNVPTLGFYGAFEPAVQPYSCRGSAYWMGKAFMALLLPADNPFWTATENEGAWSTEMKKGTVHNKYQEGAHILITDYPNIGASEIRAWCKAKAVNAGEPYRSSENYNRLSYNSAFPWQADSLNGVVAMNYVVKNAKKEWEPLRLFDFIKFEGGRYYRDAVLETQPNIRFNLMDMPLPNGIFRVDQLTADTICELRLGHYALPNLKGFIKEESRTAKGFDVKIIDNGIYQLALVLLSGWDKMEVKYAENIHPEAKRSAVINVSATYTKANKPKQYATLMLWKKSGEKWAEEELVPTNALKWLNIQK